MKKLRIGSRASNLAMIQTNWVADRIRRLLPELEIEIIQIQTHGDRVQDLPLDKLNDKGVFIKELERALLTGEVDLAVHSMKDMPSELTDGLELLPPPKGEDPADVLILDKPLEDISQLSKLRIGSGSKRRRYQLETIFPGIEVLSIRGNIETRIGKIRTEGLDGVILAKAGILRAGYGSQISYTFDPKSFLPAPCQGMLGIQIRTSDADLKGELSALADRATTLRWEAEREFQREIGAGCHSPVGIYSEVQENQIFLWGMFGDEQGSVLLYDEISGRLSDRLELARVLAGRLKEAVWQRDL